MKTTEAKVIPLDEFRRRRQAQKQAVSAPPVFWMPVWVWVPVWPLG